jgi:hypothetical protein
MEDSQPHPAGLLRGLFRQFVALWSVIVILAVIVVLGIVFSFQGAKNSTVAGAHLAVALGSTCVLIGSLGQAINELSRFGRYYRAVNPLGYKRWLDTFFSPRKAAVFHRDLERVRPALAPDIYKEITDSARKARNWLLILGGSVLLLAASIHDLIS